MAGAFVLDSIGGPDLGDVKDLPPEDRVPGWELLHSLKCCCGSLARPARGCAAPDGRGQSPGFDGGRS